MNLVLPNNWNARAHQKNFFGYMQGGGKRYVGVWHRRAGKDTAAINWTAIAAMQRVGTYWHMLPTQTQGRRNVWDYINKEGVRMIDQAFPAELRAGQPNSNEMKMPLASGSMWQVVGSDNYNALMGSNPVGVVFSEWSLTNPQAWEFVRPILAENGGWAVFIYTPRGKNHGWKQLQIAQANKPEWFSEILTVEDTKLISRTEIEMERRSGMSEELIRQEFYCSFEAPNTGSYYGRIMEELSRNGQITSVPYDPSLGVHTWWDIGVHHPTCIWFTQSSAFDHRIIDYLEITGEGLPYCAKAVAGKPYVYAGHHFPHDVRVTEWGTNRTRIEMVTEYGLSPQIVPDIGLEDGIEAVRSILPTCYFDAEKCARGIECLTSYHRKYDEERKCFSSKPEEDWSVDGADAFRYFAVGSGQTRTYREPPRSRRPSWMSS